ncbi:carbohydrate kinase family protein [Pedobacter aquatilis]|uniref:carbohydrate kinase family protein n=1 Tax=Pedobacter aquatilis TaxID=351343 RepID=UPI00293084E7|nr:carbohydrate kinase family protein [Pedobacter aquatilis]
METSLIDKKVLIIGELLADVISETDITSLGSPSTFRISQGGSSANLCANLKWLGANTELVATVGSDNLGEFLLKELRNVGLSDANIGRSACRQTSIILVGKNAETPDFIPYRSADMAIKRIDDTLIASCEVIHTTAFALSKEPARSNILNALVTAHQMGKTVSVDWNFAPSIWQEDDGKDIFRKLCRLNPLLKISVDDVERFAEDTVNIEQAIEWLDRLNIRRICLTCGKEGVWFKAQNGAWKHKPALEVETVAGVTGAGDAFWSGFLFHFINNYTLEACVDKALGVAKLKIEKPYPLYKS